MSWLDVFSPAGTSCPVRPVTKKQNWTAESVDTVRLSSSSSSSSQKTCIAQKNEADGLSTTQKYEKYDFRSFCLGWYEGCLTGCPDYILSKDRDPDDSTRFCRKYDWDGRLLQ